MSAAHNGARLRSGALVDASTIVQMTSFTSALPEESHTGTTDFKAFSKALCNVTSSFSPAILESVVATSTTFFTTISGLIFAISERSSRAAARELPSEALDAETQMRSMSQLLTV